MSNLISLFRRNSADDFESMIAPHIERLYRLAYRFCGAVQPAEDLVQDLLLKLYPRKKELAQVEELSPWLARALYNLFIDSTRKENRSPLRGAVDVDVLVGMPSAIDGPEQDLDNTLIQRRLALALDKLVPEQRVLVSLHDIEGYTLQELETMLDTPIGTLKSRLHRGRQQLRNSLEMEPFSADERVNFQRMGERP